MATQQQIADALGLSRSTVKAALDPNSTVSLSPQTIQKVRETASRLQYRPNKLAQAMRSGKSGTISMIHFGGVNQVAAQRSLAAVAAIQDAGFQCLATDVTWSPDRLQTAISAAIDTKAQGAIIITPYMYTSVNEINRLAQANIPCVAIAGALMPNVPCVRVDAHQAIRQMTHHLIGLGYTRLAIMTQHPVPPGGPSAQWPSIERLEGFQQAIKEAHGKIIIRDLTKPWSNPRLSGLTAQILSMQIAEDASNPYFTGHARMSGLIAQGDLPQAIVCSNDDWVQGALTACSKAGIRVPQDLALTGFDNALFGSYGAVPITTMADQFDQLAKTAVALLVKRIQGHVLDPHEYLVRVPCVPIIRESCGARIRPALDRSITSPSSPTRNTP